jgi:macrolide transport system ATP-binding/permease protein
MFDRVYFCKPFSSFAIVKNACSNICRFLLSFHIGEFMMNPTHFFENLIRDARYSLRVLLKNRSFTFAAVLALSLGIGISISIYTLLYSLTYRPLPVKEPENVVKIYQKFSGELIREVQGAIFMFSYPEYSYYRDQSQSFTDLIAYAEITCQVGGSDGNVVPGLLVSQNYFSGIGTNMSLGRTFVPEECATPGTHPVAIISHKLWDRNFNADPEVIGRPMVLNGLTYTIIGVAAPDALGTELTIPDIWVPLMMQPQFSAGRNDIPKWDCSWLTVVGRLKPSVPMSNAYSETAVLASQLDKNYANRTTTITMNRASYLSSPEEMQTTALAMAPVAIAVFFLLVIACTNVSNLFLARATARQKEVSIRLALGATRGRLIQQLLTESLLIGIIGGGVGLLLTFWLLKSLISVFPLLPGSFNFRPDFSVLLYTITISVVCGIACGLTPSFIATRLPLSSAMKEDGTTLGRKGSSSKLRSMLLVAQVTVCLVLLISTALLVRGLLHAQSIDLGFQPKSTFVGTLDLRDQGYDKARAAVFYRRLMEELSALPATRSVSLAAVPPLLTTSSTTISIEGRESQRGLEPTAYFNVVSPSYFETMGISLLSGSGFSEQDAQSGTPVVIVSQAMANQYWQGENPVGKYFKISEGRFQVIGVAKNVRNVQITDDSIPFFYALTRPDDQLGMKVMLRATGNTETVLPAFRSVVQSIDPNITVSLKSMEEGLDRILQPSKLSVLLSTVLGFLALALATMGTYGVTAYTTSQRLKEIGIRMALGAKRSDILFLFMRQGMKPVIIGIILGTLAAAAASQLLLKLLFGLSPLDPIAFLGASIFLVFIALTAMIVPAYRATQVDPMISLRNS